MLELNAITKRYGADVVLENLSLTIAPGELVSILGPSGSGKTTLLNIILGLSAPSEGRVSFEGRDITALPFAKRGFNIVFQDYALFPNLNARKNITYGLRNRPDLSTTKEVEALIHLLGLEKHLDKHIEELSGGQKQRVALARTLVMKPKLLLLDEPLSALDGVIKESIKENIRRVASELGLTTIIVTHDPEEALTLSDKVLILNDGRRVQYGSPREIIDAPASSFVKDFILSQLHIKQQNIGRLFGAGVSQSRSSNTLRGSTSIPATTSAVKTVEAAAA
jgi:iron(III) transport system ATP-binding protein